MSLITVPLNLTLHENQKKVQESRALNKVIKAGKRFGKTKWAIYEICKAAGMKPRGKFWFLAPTYRQAKSIAWNELNWILPKHYVKRSVENELTKTLVNDATIQLIGCDNPDALRGTKIDGVVDDECAYHDDQVWPIIRGQLLGSLGERPGFAYFISSPNERGRNWFTEFHAEAKRKMEAGDKDWAAFYFTIHDNPTLNPDQVQSLKDGMSDDKWNLEYLAIESAHAGQRYSEFNYAVHVKESEASGDLVCGMDWGIAHPTVCLWIYVDRLARTVYVEDEYVKSGNTIQESCEIIKQKTGSRPVDWRVIDPSTSKRNSQTKRTDHEEFCRWGVGCVPGDNRDRGYDITKMFFKRNMIKIHPKCKNLIYELRNLQYGDKDHDDVTDALRYALVRVHDIMFNGKLFEEIDPKPSVIERKPFSLNDYNLFPKRQMEYGSSIRQELEVY